MSLKLLLMKEWSGQSRYYEPKAHMPPELESREQQVAFITRLPLGAALRRIKAYEDAFKARY